MYQIEIKDNTNYEESIILENQVYIFTVKYNQRFDVWTLDIKTNDNVEIINGKILTLNTNILRNVGYRNNIFGFLIISPLSQNINSINRDNLSTDIGIYYVTEDEIKNESVWTDIKIFGNG